MVASKDMCWVARNGGLQMHVIGSGTKNKVDSKGYQWLLSFLVNLWEIGLFVSFIDNLNDERIEYLPLGLTINMQMAMSGK